MADVDLKRCPFCGGADIKLSEKLTRFVPNFAWCCRDCGAQSGWEDSIKKAIEAWNRRTKAELRLWRTRNDIRKMD